MIGIYKILNKVNNKIYVGQSRNIKNRWNYHCNRLNKNCHPNNLLQNSWNKYGEVNFDFLMIEECNLEELQKRENFWCKELKTHQKLFGYNLTITTDNKTYSLTEEGKQKISIAHKGKILSQETKNLISKRLLGRELSNDTKVKMSNSKLGSTFSEKSRNKMSVAKKGKTFHSSEKWLKVRLKPVLQCDLNGNIIKEFPSMKEAEKELNIRANYISACCTGRKKKVNNFTFKYKI